MDQQILFSSEDQAVKSFDNFYAAENINILCALNTFLLNVNEFGCFYIFGESGCGKTHLLKSAVGKFQNGGAYLDVSTQSEHLRAFSNDEAIRLLAIDNLENSSEHDADMMLVFETFRQRPAKLIVASEFAPRALSRVLKDIRTRLTGGQVFELKTLDDKQKVKALELRARLRGFKLSDEVIRYVINRYPRDFNSLFGLLDRLDNASLKNQRKITVPFIKKLEG